MIKLKIKKSLLIAVIATQTFILPHTALAVSEDLAKKEEPLSFFLVEQGRKIEFNSFAEVIIKSPEDTKEPTSKEVKQNDIFISEEQHFGFGGPEVTPTPSPTPEPRKLDNVEAYKARICEVFPAHECQNALTIAWYESKFDPWALSATGDRGLMQINCYWHKDKVGGDCQQLYDPETNIQVAFQIWSAQGWCPWSTRHHIGVYCGY